MFKGFYWDSCHFSGFIRTHTELENLLRLISPDVLRSAGGIHMPGGYWSFGTRAEYYGRAVTYGEWSKIEA